MFYVYILLSLKDWELYTGCTNNLKNRFNLHNSGKITSTEKRRPFKLIYYEAFLNKHDAFTREQWLKTGWGKKQLEKILRHYFEEIKK